MSNILLINKEKKFLKHGDNFLRKASHPERDYFYIKLVASADGLWHRIKIGEEYYHQSFLEYNIVNEKQTYDESNFTGGDSVLTFEDGIILSKETYTIYFRCNHDIEQIHNPKNTDENHFLTAPYNIEGIIEIGGNIMSLFYKDFEDKLTLNEYTCVANMFYQETTLISIKNLKLPATTLTERCYSHMFDGCTSLTTVPYDLLPATTLASSCYSYMFQNCTKLKNTPNLPATTLASSCYSYMFYKCESLRYAQRVISATYIDYNACQYMFQGCTKLLKSPIIKTKEGFAGYSCQGMFEDCTSLVDAGEIGIFDYRNAGVYMFNKMFQNCKSLVVAPTVHFRPYSDGTISEAESMFQGCTSLVDASGIKFYNFKIDSNDYNFAKSMFEDCTSLTKTPDMKNASGAYMFKNCKSLVNVTNSDTTLYVKDSMFMGCSKLKTVSNNENFSIYLSGGYAPFCFNSCTSLTTFPKIKSQSSYEDLCCSYMFANCTSLSKFPNTNDLVNFKLSNSCFNNMFNGCTSITTLPKSFLSNVNALKESCYKEMFYGCTSLKVAPELSAETINVNNAYKGMFTNCTSLTTAKLSLNEFGSSANHVCQDMFNGCSKLSNVSVGFTSFSYMNNHKNNNLSNWLNGVASSGIMNVPNTYAWTTESITHSVNGIPSGWVVNPVL